MVVADREPAAVRLTRALELVEDARRSILVSAGSAYGLLRRAERLIREVREEIGGSR